MAVELWTTANTVPFVRGGSPLVRYETIAEDQGRSGDMLSGTVLGRVANGGKWVPLDIAATDGSQWPAGVLLRTLTEADIQAGDILNVPIMTGGSPPAILAEEGLTFEGGVNPASPINVPAGTWLLVREAMAQANMYIIEGQDIERAQVPPPPGP